MVDNPFEMDITPEATLDRINDIYSELSWFANDMRILTTHDINPAWYHPGQHDNPIEMLQQFEAHTHAYFNILDAYRKYVSIVNEKVKEYWDDRRNEKQY